MKLSAIWLMLFDRIWNPSLWTCRNRVPNHHWRLWWQKFKLERI